MTEELGTLYPTVESNCEDLVLSSQILFQAEQGKGVSEFYETLKLKINTNIKIEIKIRKNLKGNQIIQIAAIIFKFDEKTSATQTKTLIFKVKNKLHKTNYQLLLIKINIRLGIVMVQKIKKIIKPQWHAPWKLLRVISGHHGWVRCIAVDPGNQFFLQVQVIEPLNSATGNLKLTFTGHFSTIRSVIVSARHPYLFSCAEDKTEKCWDLEQNKMIRDYHEHLSGVYSLVLHPTLDVLVSDGRDSVCRAWDIRARQQIHILEGHTNTIDSIICQNSSLKQIKLWDMTSGKCISTLTNHKKSVNAMAFHQNTAASDNLKVLEMS